MGKPAAGRKVWGISQADLEKLLPLLSHVAIETDQAAIDEPTLPKEKWQLNKEAFANLLARLDPDPDSAGKKYVQIHERLIFFFERRRCPNPNELADKTFDRVCRRLGQGEEIGKLGNFAMGWRGASGKSI